MGIMDRARIRRFLAESDIRRLQIGAGNNVRKGWLNTNWYPIRLGRNGAIFLDATERFPFPDNSIDRIFTEHMIEHVPYGGGRAMLSECLRVLKPGGRIRISTPDMAFLVGLLQPDPSPLQRSYVEWAASRFLRHGQPHTALSVVNNFVRDWGHTYIYDRPTLEGLLAEMGFCEITPCEVNQSEDPDLNGIDFPERFLNPDYLRLESMVYEASKPL